MTARLKAMLGTKRRLAVSLAVFAMVAVACHGYFLDSGPQYWYLDSNQCIDRSNRIRMTAVGNTLGATTGTFDPGSPNCTPKSHVAGFWIGAQSRLWKQNPGGICQYGTLYNNNSPDWFVNHEQQFAHCGSDNYSNFSYHYGHDSQDGHFVETQFFGPGDHL